MLTLEQAMADQDSLEKLCKPRAQYRHEIYSPNDNYGHAYILKTYAGYPIDQPIHAIFPHGIYFRDKVVSQSELNHHFGAVLNFPPFTMPLWKKLSKNKKIIPFASPMHYALKLFKPEIKPS